MISVSREFSDTMRKRTDFKEYADITLADGTVLNLSASDFTVSNNYINDGASASQIPLGVAIERNIQIEIMNDQEQYSTYDFYGAVIELYLTFQLSETVEKVVYGRFKVITPETYGETVIITAVDDMYKADKPYSTSLTFPATTGAMLREICARCDLPRGSSTFQNSDFVVNTAPDSSYTFRAVIGFIAMIAGGNARINRSGELEIITYNFSILENLRGYDGGTFKPWESNADLDGGSFNPWDTGDVADAGLFTDYDDVQVLYNWKNLKVDTDDIVITGIKTTYTDENDNELEILEGSEGYVLGIENPLIAGKEAEAVALIGAVMIGGKYRKFEGDHISYPVAEFMDPVFVVDRRSNVYQSIITDVNFAFCGFTTIKNSSESAIRNSSQYLSESVKAYVAARKLVTKERTERQKAVEQLAYKLAHSSGLYITEEKQKDGSSIYYMHDKSTLAESMIVWKLTAEALGISTDGGKTYPYGLDVTAVAILNKIYAIGINADYIKSGSLTVGGAKNAIGTIIVLDEDNKEIGRWDKTGINAKGTFASEGMNEWNYLLREAILENGTFIIKENGKVETKFSLVKINDDIFGTGIGTALSELSLGILTNEGNTFTQYYILNNGSNRNGFTERHLFNGYVRFLNGPRVANFYLMPNNTSLDESAWLRLYMGTYDSTKALLVDGGLYAYGSMGCSGTKYRVVDTEHYGKRGMNAFETAEAYFSDIGSGVIGEDGTCRIDFDPVFVETIEKDKPYQVQLTRTSAKEANWVEKNKNYFVVHGEPGATFDWMIMCKQKGYADVRMQEIILKAEVNDNE